MHISRSGLCFSRPETRLSYRDEKDTRSDRSLVFLQPLRFVQGLLIGYAVSLPWLVPRLLFVVVVPLLWLVNMAVLLVSSLVLVFSYLFRVTYPPSLAWLATVSSDSCWLLT